MKHLIKIGFIGAILFLAVTDAYQRNRNGNPSSLARGQSSWRTQSQTRQNQDYIDQQSPGFGNVGDYEGVQFGSAENFGDIQQSINSDPDAEEFAQQQSQYKWRTTTTRSSTTTAPAAGWLISSTTPGAASEKLTGGTPQITTDKGTFKGKIETTPTGKTIYAFLGIPFGKPPVGPLRFKRPVPADKLESVFEATQLPNACTQESGHIFPGFSGEEMWRPNTNISEDCLYLNIWVPETVIQKKDQELVPVMFWIYGGGFFSGSSSMDVYNGAILASQEEVIVVSTQYRVGPLGFFYLGTEDAPGNVGLWDQNLAIKWVNENIEEFGGDPNKVTLFGESAGAASVGLHMLCPASRNYFKRAVMMSGLPSQDYSYANPNILRQRSLKLAKLAGCDPRQTSQEIITCMQNIEPSVLSRLQFRLYKNMLEFAFVPTIDGEFLTNEPMDVIKNGDAKRTELMIGTVEDEGSYFVLYQYLKYFHHDQPTSVSRERFVDILKEIFNDRSEIELDAIINHYTGWENPEDGFLNQKKLQEAVGDAFFTCPIREFADTWSDRGLKTYYYHLTQRSSQNPWAQWMGVMHGDDIPFFLGQPANDTKGYTLGEKQLSIYIMRLLGNFAKLGIPSENWERYTTETPVYLELNATKPSDASTPNRYGPHADNCALWNHILPQLQRLSARQQKPNRNRNLNQCAGQSPKRGRGQQQHSFGHNSPAPEEDTENPWRNRGVHGGQGFYINTLDQQYQYPYHNHAQGAPYCIPPPPSPTVVPQVPISSPVPKNFGQNQPTFGQPSASCKKCCDQNTDYEIPTPEPV